MARFEKRLPVYSSNDPDIDWRLADAEVKFLEGSYQTMSAEALADLYVVCRRFMHWKRVEMEVGRASDADKVWRSIKVAVEGFASVAAGGGFPEGDEGRYVQQTFIDALAGVQIQLTEHDFHPETLDLALWGQDAPIADSVLHIRPSFLTRFAQALWLAISRTESEFVQAGDGFLPGEAFPDWLREMKQWAKQYGYQHGSSSSAEPSRFVCFLHNLNWLFPEAFREPVNSVSAMNDRLKRAIRPIKTAK